MNRQEALEWCVENIDEWTSVDLHIYTKKSLPLHWRVYTNPVRLVNHKICTQIEMRDWLDAKAKKESGVKLYIGDTPEQLKKGVTPTDQPYMPQVGEECEYSLNGGETWHKLNKARLFSRNGYPHNFAVAECDNVEGDQVLWLDRTVFRPIKTEREKFVDRARSINRKLTIGANEEQMLNAFFDEGMTFND